MAQTAKFNGYKPDRNGRYENDIGEDGFNYYNTYFNGSEILYVELNKNRTNGWLSRNQLQLPLGITAHGPIGSISLVHRKSNGYFSSENQETEVPEWKKKLAEFSAGESNNNSSPKSGNASAEVQKSKKEEASSNVAALRGKSPSADEHPSASFPSA